MYTYRIVLDGYNSRDTKPGARVVTYSTGFNRQDALRNLGTVYVGQDGSVSDGINKWPGANKLPGNPADARAFPEYEMVSMRSVPKAGKAYVMADKLPGELIFATFLPGTGDEIMIRKDKHGYAVYLAGRLEARSDVGGRAVYDVASKVAGVDVLALPRGRREED